MGFTLQDDGTLDTVLRCDKCAEYLRFDSASLLEGVLSVSESILDEKRIENAMAEAEDQHDCSDRRL